jgi:hypothetical protein
MQICPTCQKALTDQTEVCPYCEMVIDSPYSLPEYILEYRDFPRWTLFPPVPKTQWWGKELKRGPASRQQNADFWVSNGAGMFAIGPEPALNLNLGLYEFHCLLAVNRVSISEKPIGITHHSRNELGKRGIFWHTEEHERRASNNK